MADKLNEAIQEIAVKHGIVLSKDDPILILQTMNERLIEENQRAQAAMLAQFREEIQEISAQWKDDAKEKAEKILNVSLAGGKEVMARLLQESIRESAHAIKKMISDSLAEAQDITQQARKFSRFALLSSVATLALSCLVMLFFLVYVLQ